MCRAPCQKTECGAGCFVDFQDQPANRSTLNIKTCFFKVFENCHVIEINPAKRRNPSLTISFQEHVAGGKYAVKRHAMHQMDAVNAGLLVREAVQALELMLNQGWIVGSLDPGRPKLSLSTPSEGQIIHTNKDLNEVLESLA